MKSLLLRYKISVIIFAAALTAVFALYGNTLGNGFTLDDHPVIENRETLRSLANIPHFFVESWHPNGAWGGNYRPLTVVTFALNWAVSHEPWGFHLVNILLHALNVTLVFLLVRRFASVRVAALTAILFLAVPIHSEAVASIAARNGLLAFSLIMLATMSAWDGKHWRGAAWFLAALFSSDFATGFLPLVAGLLAVKHRWAWRPAMSAWWKYLLPLVIYFPIRYLALGPYTFHGEGYVNQIIGPLAFVPFKERVLTGLVHLTIYLQKTFIPVGLSPDYSFNQIPIVHGLFESVVPWIGALLLMLAATLFIRGNAATRVGVLIFVVPFLLISNIAVVTTGTMAERWWYLPSFGVLLLAAIGVNAILRSSKHLRVLMLIILAGALIWWGVVLIKQNAIWKNDHTRTVAAAVRSPQSAWAHVILAGQYFVEKKYQAAQDEIDRSLAIADNNSLAWFTQGKLAWLSKDYRAAELAFIHARKVDLHDHNARSLNRSLALLYFDQGRNTQALAAMREAVKWPIAGDTRTVTAVDEYLVDLLTEYEHKDPRRYSTQEVKQFGNMIRAIMEF